MEQFAELHTVWQNRAPFGASLLAPRVSEAEAPQQGLGTQQQRDVAAAAAEKNAWNDLFAANSE